MFVSKSYKHVYSILFCLGVVVTMCKSICPHATHRLNWQWLIIASIVLVLLGVGEVIAAPMNIAAKAIGNKQSHDPTPADAFSNPAELIDELQKKLVETRAELAGESVNFPKAVGQDGIFPRRLFLQMLLHAYEGQIRRVKELQLQQERFAKWEGEAKRRSESAKSEPFPFLFVDQLRESLATNEKRLARLNEMLAQVEREEARRITVAEQSAIKLRQANEELERSQGIAKVLVNEKSAELALRHRLDWIRVVAPQVEIQRIQQDMQEIRSKSNLAETLQAKLHLHARITDQEIQIVRDDIQAERQKILDELQSIMAELNVDQVADNLPAAADRALQDTDDLKTAIKQAGEFKLQALEWMLEFLQVKQMIWEYRWASVTVDDREKAREAYEQIINWQHNLKVAREYIERMRLAALEDATQQKFNIHPLDSQPDFEFQPLNIDRVKTLSRALASLESIETLLLRTQQDFDARFQVKTKAERWNEFLLNLREFAGDVWQYELFVAEDILEVDGQQIKGKRSITVDKVVRALLILFVGYWLAVKLAVFIEQFAVKRLVIDPCLARIARRWILFVEIMMLAMISMMVVHIPLTVFAFMGGAVAIGAGFGMQNLLKNLISGLMLLLERPFRPGDLVEVDGIRGRITDIGVRSSHIRDGNGIETLIPNSTFIEEKVTNWTLSSRSVRIAVQVGVAYGSPVQEVTSILLEAAERHGLIQANPQPKVLFEDFGNDALIFGLYVWLELSPEIDWRDVASDLRYIINKRFSSEGIEIAFPQRDVNLDVKQPLVVRMLNDSENYDSGPKQTG